MLSAEFINPELCSSPTVTTLDVGRQTILARPDYRLLISDNGATILYVDIHLDRKGGSSCFSAIHIHQRCIVIGCGESVHFILPDQLTIKSVKLADYFGSFYPLSSSASSPSDDVILVCSASRLYCFNYIGHQRWLSEQLGIDGVLVQRIEDNRLYGAGEWDPPDGWLPFCLNIYSGEQII